MYVKGYENQINYVTDGFAIYDAEGNVIIPMLPKGLNIYDEVKELNKKWIRKKTKEGEQVWQRI